MKKLGLLGTSAIGSAAFIGFSLAAAPAYAQSDTAATAPAPQPCPAGTDEATARRDNCLLGEVELKSNTNANGEEAGNESILVTGSRIRRPGLTSNVPVTSIGAEELTSQGDVNIGDALNDLPSLRSTFSQQNSTRFIGTAGVNTLDLRGLGTNRTLVLVNGRRHVGSSPGDFDIDVNTIPTDLLDRVDVITGGSSAVYGSDAIAGVVNFVLKRDFDGIRLRSQAGVSQRGDRAIEFTSLTAGTNFAGDRGNIAINVEYVNAEPLYFIQRDKLTGAYSGRCQFNTTDFTVGEPASGDGVSDTTFQCGTRNQGISNGGQLQAASPVIGGVAVACTDPRLAPGGTSAALGAARCYQAGTQFGALRTFNFQPGGQLAQADPGLDLRPFGPSNFVGGSGYGATLRDTGQLAPGLDRYMANVLAHFDISQAFRPFMEAKFVRVDALQEGQPSFFQSTFPAFFGGGRGIRCDNPFLTAGSLATLQSVGRCLGGNTSTETLQLGRFDVDFGGRQERIRRDTYRAVLGIQGDFNDDWNYEISGTYGRTTVRSIEENNLYLFDINGNPAGFLLATDAVRNTNGEIVCRANLTTITAPGCVPLNPFGVGSPSQAALDYVQTTSIGNAHQDQYDVAAFVNGDLSQLFELPGGPIGFVLGAEYREEHAASHFDPLTAASGTFFNAIQPFNPPPLKTKEVFGEISIPLLKDLPFARELSVTGAARYSDYNTPADKTFSYNVNGTWAPVQDLRFRANYSKAVRVPTLSDLYAPFGQNFAFLADPCDVLNIGPPGTNRYNNCVAQGIPAGFINQPARSQTSEILSGGNPFLTEETGKSITIGGVFTPRWIPGLSLTVDYYRIKVKNLIAVLAGQTILNQCYDLPDLSNQFCQLINPRNPDFTFATPALQSGGINFAKQQAYGIDFDLAYRHTFGNGDRLNLRGIATKVIRRNNFTSPTDPTFKSRVKSNLGDPEWTANASASYDMGNVNIRYSLNYVGKQTITAYSNYFAVQGRPPVNADATPRIYYPDILYHAARIAIKVDNRFTFYGGVDNIFDRQPPLGLIGTAAGEPFDSIGRYIYFGATVNLGSIGELFNR
jgi:outer membrane receptor protein involved in Fe transport